MRRRLPPPNWLRAFEAAARHLSFTGAARELGVTQAAVSQQVKLLEAQLGKPLFHRLARSLQLTDTGEAYATVVREAFQRLGGGTDAIFGPDPSSALALRSAVTFGLLWLAPRLPRLARAQPRIDLRLTLSIWPVEFDWDAIDLEIRYGNGRWPALRAERLTWDSLFAVMSPALRAAGPPLRTPRDLLGYPLLEVFGHQTGWSDWLLAAGVERRPAQRLQFDTSAMALEAAAAGAGVALGRTSITDGYLASGRLVAPFADSVPTDEAFYLVCPADRLETRNAALFADWLRAELAGQAGAPAGRGTTGR